MKRKHYWTAGILFMVTINVIFGIAIYRNYPVHKMEELRQEGSVVWFKNALQESETCLPDDIVWQLSYYHKNVKPERLPSLMPCLLDQKEVLIEDGHYTDFVSHFFAAALHSNKGIIDDFRKIGADYTGIEKTVVENIVGEAERFQSSDPDSPEEIMHVWAEYMATGKEEPIKKLVHVLKLPETEENRGQKSAVANSFVTNIPRFYDVYTVLKNESSRTEGPGKDLIDSILAAINGLENEAYTILNRGHNYYKFKKYDTAIEEYEEALRIFPHYASVYVNMSIAYEYKGDKDKALFFLKKADLLNPYSPSISYNLGRYYYNSKKYDMAIEQYSSAVKERPEKENYNHALARAYQMNGDYKNAIKYFKAYLKYAPHGEFEPYVKQYLATMKVPIEEDSSDIVLMLQRKQYDRLNHYFRDLLNKKEKDNDGNSKLANAYEALLDPPGNKHVPERWLAYFEDWVRVDGSSHFANALLGMFYKDYAWDARGTSWSSSVTDEGRKLYRERLLKASEYLEKAYILDNSDPIVPAKLITVAKGLGLDKAQMEMQFQRALNADETEFTAYNRKLTYLMPKWYGSRDEMFSFAKKTARTAPPDSSAPKILAMAHWEMYYRSKDESYFRNPAVWREIKKAYIKVLKSFPDSMKIHNWMAKTAYMAGDYTTAKKEFEVIGNDWSTSCWGNRGYFEEVKKEVIGLSETVTNKALHNEGETRL